MNVGDWVRHRTNGFVGPIVESYTWVVRVEMRVPEEGWDPYHGMKIRGNTIFRWWPIGREEFEEYTPTPEEEQEWILAKLSG